MHVPTSPVDSFPNAPNAPPCLRCTSSNAPDCGGDECPGCDEGEDCNDDDDCASGSCDSATGTCDGYCSNGVQDSGEEGVDCGGSCPGNECPEPASGCPPGFPVPYPRIVLADAESTDAVLEVEMTIPGMYYFVVVEDGSTPPSSAEVHAGTAAGGGAAIAAGSRTVGAAYTTAGSSLGELSLSTDYDVYLVAHCHATDDLDGDGDVDDDDIPGGLPSSPTLVGFTSDDGIWGDACWVCIIILIILFVLVCIVCCLWAWCSGVCEGNGVESMCLWCPWCRKGGVAGSGLPYTAVGVAMVPVHCTGCKGGDGCKCKDKKSTASGDSSVGSAGVGVGVGDGGGKGSGKSSNGNGVDRGGKGKGRARGGAAAASGGGRRSPRASRVAATV